jgi:hypothetical protein
MTAIINGSSPSVTFSDGTTQATSAIVSGYVPYANLPAGSVLQVVNGFDQSYASTTSTSYVDSPLSATITPKFSTSKILVIATVTAGASGGRGGSLRVVRGATTVQEFANGTGQNNAGSTYNTQAINFSMTTLDSPATTSATTYKVQYAAISGTLLYNWYDNSAVAASTLTLVEIAQ